MATRCCKIWTLQGTGFEERAWNFLRRRRKFCGLVPHEMRFLKGFCIVQLKNFACGAIKFLFSPHEICFRNDFCIVQLKNFGLRRRWTIPNGCCMNHDLCTIIIHNSSYELGSVSNALDPMHWTGLPHPHRDFIAFSWDSKIPAVWSQAYEH